MRSSSGKLSRRSQRMRVKDDWLDGGNHEIFIRRRWAYMAGGCCTRVGLPRVLPAPNTFQRSIPYFFLCTRGWLDVNNATFMTVYRLCVEEELVT